MVPAQASERLHAVRLYWFFVDPVWIVILVAFYTFLSLCPICFDATGALTAARAPGAARRSRWSPRS